MKGKSILALILALAMAFGCFACAGGQEAPAAEAPAAEAAPAGDESLAAGEFSAKRGSANESVNHYVEGDEGKVKLADKQKIVFTAQESSGSYDPIRDEQIGELTTQMFEGLYTWKNGKIVPGMAKELELADDNVTYTITLRDDIFWSDGQPVTAHDFVNSWFRELDPVTAAKYVRNLYNIKGAQEYNEGTGSKEDVQLKAIDDTHLTLTLTSPSVCFEEMLTNKTFFPVRLDIVEKYGETWAMSPETCIGNGPFMMKEYSVGEKMTFVKNPYYYDADKILIEELEARFITDSSVELIAYQNGEIDIATHATAETMASYPADAWSYPKLTCMWLVVNCEKDYLADARVRKALALAIDRDALANAVVMGGVTPAYTIIPSTFMDYSAGKLFNETHDPYFHDDPEEARRLLAEAGFPDGKGFPTITYGTSASTEYENVAQAVTAMWKQELGINAEIKIEDSTQFIADRKGGAFDTARYILAGTYSDPMNFVNLYKSTDVNNDSRYRDPEYDALVKKALDAGSIEEKYQYYHEADQYLIDNMVVIPLYYPAYMYLFKSKVAGVGVDLAGIFSFVNAYVVAE